MAWQTRQALTSLLTTMTKLLNKADAPNPAAAPRFQSRSQWRGVGDLQRSTSELS